MMLISMVTKKLSITPQCICVVKSRTNLVRVAGILGGILLTVSKRGSALSGILSFLTCIDTLKLE